MTYDEWLKRTGAYNYNDGDRDFGAFHDLMRSDNGINPGIWADEENNPQRQLSEFYGNVYNPDASGRQAFGTEGLNFGQHLNFYGGGDQTDSISRNVTLDGRDYWRGGEDISSWVNAPGLGPTVKQALSGWDPKDLNRYDPTYGYLVPMEYKTALDKAQQADNKGKDGFFGSEGPFQAFSKTIGLAMGLSNLAGMGLNGLASGGGQYANWASSMLPDGGYQSLFSGLNSTNAATGGVGGLADMPWGVNPQGSVNPIYDDIYSAYNSGAMTPASFDMTAFTGAGDPIQAISALDTLSGGGGATAGAKALGFDSVSAALASVDPKWASPGILEKLASSSLGKLLTGNASGDDYVKALGAVGSAGLGLLGSNAQGDALNGVSDKYMALGKPFRDKLSASYAPGFDLAQADPAYQGALDQSSNAVLKGLSAKGGNPFDNPGAVMEANKYVTQNVGLPQLNTYRSQLGSFGQLGINTAGTADMGGASLAGSGLDAIGTGLEALTGNNNTFEDFIKKYGGMLGGSNFKINNASSF